MTDPDTAVPTADIDDVRRLYLDLMKRTLTRYAFGEAYQPYEPRKRSIRHAVFRGVRRYLDRKDLEIVGRYTFREEARADGSDWPPEAETMIGLQRLDNLEECITRVIADGVGGDLIETGVWRGGACIFMRAVLKAHDVTDRRVWVADSFRGLPEPEEGRVEDIEDALWTYDFLAVSQDQVEANFARYQLLDDQVEFLNGWFKDTLPTAPIGSVAVLRLDGDMYDSTMVALESLYPKLSVGGYVIVDDYHAVRACQEAVDDFRAANAITDKLQQVDWTCRYWQRSR